ncbi:MAG TPA: hypothetical protein VFG87_22505 [Amycolatopsis sp.]|nr:hypothetical protein [Amycolatopsis sp.]
MRVVSATAPSVAELRAARKNVVGSHFPIHHELADRLVEFSGPPGPDGLTQDDFLVAHLLATCAGYAYSDAATLSMIMARMGLGGNRCLEISHDVDVMHICSTVFLVQSRDGRVVIVAYRGTPPEKLLAELAHLARHLPGVVNLPFLPSLDDHFPQRYLARPAPEGVISEFGD